MIVKQIKCPHCGKDVKVASLLGAKTSKAKADASRVNGAKPPRPGSRPRGRPLKQND